MGKKGEEVALDPISLCLGDVKVTVVVDTSSPAGRGNGEAQAGPIAAQFGLEHNGAFLRFIGGPLAPRSEHWHVTQTVPVGSIPCAGGASKGSLKINNGLGRPATYTVTWDVEIDECGVIDKKDFALAQGRVPRGLGMGGRVGNILRQVDDGDRLPFPLKNPPPGGTVVGPGGQPRRPRT